MWLFQKRHKCIPPDVPVTEPGFYSVAPGRYPHPGAMNYFLAPTRTTPMFPVIVGMAYRQAPSPIQPQTYTAMPGTVLSGIGIVTGQMVLQPLIGRQGQKVK